MENRKLLRIIFILLVIVTIPVSVSAYSINTHSFLTDEAINFYNKHFSDNQIPDDKRDFLIDGSRHEESFPRPLNHFYDPVKNRGLEALVANGYPSPVWAVNSEKQNEAKYKITTAVASILTAVKERRISALTTETDFTWDRAKKFYLKGDKEKAMYLLGHILHLIQDISVPSHTRNDFILKKDSQIYESWANKFNLETRDYTLPRRLISKEPFVLNDLKFYFNELALYSNNNFYSKNTIGIQSYGSPTSGVLEMDQGEWFRFSYDNEFGKYHLVREKNIGNHNHLVNFSINLSLQDKKKLIFTDYWSLLSTKSVQYGAGVINLFFEEVKEIENNPVKLAQFLKEEKTFFGKVIDFIKNTFNIGDDFKEGDEISLLDERENNNILENETIDFCSFETKEKPFRETIIINEVSWMGDNDDYRHEWIELKNISDTEINISGYQVIDKKEQIQFTVPSETTLSSGNFYLIERNDDNSAPPSADGIYKGTLSNNNEGLKLFDSNCKLLDEVLADPNWPAGNNNTKQTMERENSFLWHNSQNTGGTPKKENSTPDFTINPQVSISKKNIKRGETIYENGRNFSYKNQVELHFILPNNKEVVDPITTDKNGSFEKIYTMPDNALLGEYTYYAVDTKTGIQSNKINYSVIEKKDEENLEEKKEKDLGENPDDLDKIEAQDNQDENIDILSTQKFSGCSDGQININSANNSYLKEIVGIGPVYAQKIIELREEELFWSLDDLARISGIADTKISQIKKENLACVASPEDSTFTPYKKITYSGGGGGGDSSSSSNENNPPNAQFSYSPESPIKNTQVSFDASSSTDDNKIISYQWDFGDGESSTISKATTTHTYISSGSYQVSLTVFDSENSSSTATELIYVTSAVSGETAKHIVISEVMPGLDGEAGKEWVELYNPTENEINLANWSLKRKLNKNTTSTQTLVGEIADSIILPNGFYLISSQDYSSLNCDETYSHISYHLAYNDDGIILYNNLGEKVDETFYDSIPAGKSWERNAFENNTCYSAQGNYEFKGNGCEGLNSFSIRDNPNPQNSSSLPEPRKAPISNQPFSMTYDPEKLRIYFNWDEYKDFSGSANSILYEIKEYSSPGIVIFSSTTLNYSKKINEVGRNYNFSFQAFDVDGLGSAITTSTISVPSLVDNFYIYEDPRPESSNNYLAEFYYPDYPFIPDIYRNSDNQTRKMMVVYLNKEPPKINSFTLQGGGYGWKNLNEKDVIQTKFSHCAGGEKKEKAILLPDISSLCTNSGTASAYSLNYDDYGLGEDNHILIKLASSTSDINFNNQDYFTLSFYGYRESRSGRNYFDLVAVDKKKYFFQETNPEHEAPFLGDLNINFDGVSNLNINWPIVTDPDTVDFQINYEINFIDISNSSSTEFNNENWESNGNRTFYTKNVSPGKTYFIGVRARDDFNNYSDVSTTTWSYPPSLVVFKQEEINDWTDGTDSWGRVNKVSGEANKASFQSLKFFKDISFDKAAVKIKQLDTIHTYDSNIRLSVLKSTSTGPDFDNVLANSVRSNILKPDFEEDFIFSFNNPVNLQANEEHWFVLDVSSGGYADKGYFNNEWANAVKKGNVYQNGEAGTGRYKGENSNCSGISDDLNQCSFDGNYHLGPADWYLKLFSD